MCIDFIDISMAFFQAEAMRKVYAALPPRDSEEGMCGLLGKSPGRTRDAVRNWNEADTEVMERQ